MNPDDREELILRYRERIERLGQDIRGLASGTEERREIRFAVLSQVGNLDGASILDLGCGFGDFYSYLKGLRLKVDYSGYDISPDVISVAKQRFRDAHFEVRDIQDKGIPKKFDYIISSQTFNFRLRRQDNYELIKDILKASYSMSRRGMAFDFLSSYVDFQQEDLFHYEPEKIFAYCKCLTKRVSLRHDYPLFEFAIYAYPSFEGWGKAK